MKVESLRGEERRKRRGRELRKYSARE